ncbi:MAG: hypothetical protein K8U57_19445 [Planctomycetes bacterium]|nr:hypothetical protein [Planctomycetota bacterium]
MICEIIELNDSGLPGESRNCELGVVPRIGELLAFVDEYFEIVNVIHQIGQSNGQLVKVFVRPTKAPYQEPKSRFGFGGIR